MPYTILLIDDDAAIRATVSELLASRYERVVTAPCGEDGLVIARAIHADLILLDYNMPDMDGLAVLKQLKADETTRRIPVVALTSGAAEQANSLSRAGCIGFIPKPFEPMEFLQLVDELLRATVGRSPSP
jgi:two-component system, cell cycle response regulator DivK